MVPGRHAYFAARAAGPTGRRHSHIFAMRSMLRVAVGMGGNGVHHAATLAIFIVLGKPRGNFRQRGGAGK
jgi:hypothetical protein